MIDKSLLVAFQEARALIEHGWTKGAHARASSNEGVHPNDPRAIKYCLVGALHHVSTHKVGYMSLRNRVELALDNADLVSWNDSQESKLPVLAVLDKIIKQLEPLVNNA